MGPNAIAATRRIETYGGGGDRVLGFMSEALGNTLHFMSKNKAAQRLFFIMLGAVSLAGCSSATAGGADANVGNHIPAAQATAVQTTRMSTLTNYLDCPDPGARLMTVRHGSLVASGDLGQQGTLICVNANGKPAAHAPVMSQYYELHDANGTPHGDKTHDGEMTAYCTSPTNPAGSGSTPDIHTSANGAQLDVQVSCGTGTPDLVFGPVYA